MAFLNNVVNAPKEIRLDLRNSVGKPRLKTVAKVYLMANIPYSDRDKFDIYRVVSGLACFQTDKGENFDSGGSFPYVVSNRYHRVDTPSHVERLFYRLLDRTAGVDSVFLDILSKMAVRMILEGAYFNCDLLLHDLLNWSDAIRKEWELLFVKNISAVADE